MKRKLVVFLASLISTVTLAAPVDLSWTNPTLNTDGTSIPASGQYSLVETRVEYSVCINGNEIDSANLVAGPVVPASDETIIFDITAPGDYCFTVKAVNTEGEISEASNVAQKSILTPVPNPPTSLTVANLVVKTIVKQENRFVLVGVGTVPAGTVCDPNQSINGHNAVPISEVTWSGSIRPVVVVAQCS